MGRRPIVELALELEDGALVVTAAAELLEEREAEIRALEEIAIEP